MNTPDLFPTEEELARDLERDPHSLGIYSEPEELTPGELLLEAQMLYDDEEDEQIEAIAEDYEGDDAYARDVCVKRWGPL